MGGKTMKTSKFKAILAILTLTAITGQTCLFGMNKSQKDGLDTLGKMALLRENQEKSAQKVIAALQHDELFKYFKKNTPQKNTHCVVLLDEFITWLEKINEYNHYLDTFKTHIEKVLKENSDFVHYLKIYFGSFFKITQDFTLIANLKINNPLFTLKKTTLSGIYRDMSNLNIFLPCNASQELTEVEQKIVSQCSEILAKDQRGYTELEQFILFTGRTNQKLLTDISQTSKNQNFIDLAQLLLIIARWPQLDLTENLMKVLDPCCFMNELCHDKKFNKEKLCSPIILQQLCKKMDDLVGAYSNLDLDYKTTTAQKDLATAQNEIQYLFNLWQRVQPLLSDMNHYKKDIDQGKFQDLLKKMPKTRQCKPQKPTLHIQTDETIFYEDELIDSPEKKDLYKIETTPKPYRNVSHYISCWLSGKGHWDESLKKVQSNYGYNNSYMEQHKEELVQSHALPLEADDFIESLATKEPWLNSQGIQTGWFYAVPGYLENHRIKSKLCGLFTWGVNLMNTCMHRSFTIRKDEELFNKMKHSEYQKEILESSQINDNQTTTLGKKHNHKNSVIHNEWYVIVHNKETHATLYLSKCMYKAPQKTPLEK